MKKKAAIFWSGGKDAAYALYKTLPDHSVRYLITTISDISGRVAMHGLREELIEAQSQAIGIPLLKMRTREATNSSYEESLSQVFKKLKEEGIRQIIYGDIFLEDLKRYRDNLMQEHGLTGVYPLWKKDTSALLDEIRNSGIKAIICCANAQIFDGSICGAGLEEIEKSTVYDPCGENGEYHSFCYDAPYFKQPVKFRTGEVVRKELGEGELKSEFYYIDITMQRDR